MNSKIMAIVMSIAAITLLATAFMAQNTEAVVKCKLTSGMFSSTRPYNLGQMLDATLASGDLKALEFSTNLDSRNNVVYSVLVVTNVCG